MLKNIREIQGDFRAILQLMVEALGKAVDYEYAKLQGRAVGGLIYRFEVPELLKGIREIYEIASPVSADNAVSKLSEIEDICLKLMADGEV